jgi:hypothetical protein
MNGILVLIFLLLILGGAIFYGLYIRPKKRHDELSAYAAKLGFTLQPDPISLPLETIAPLRLFCIQPTGGEFKNVFVSNEPKRMIFDYEYHIPRDQTVGQTVALFETHGKQWPKLVVETKIKERFTVQFMRSLTQKLANWMTGYQEIDLSLYPEFAEHYRVFSAREPKLFSELLPDVTRKILLQNPGWTLEAMDNWVLIYRQGKYIEPKSLERFIDQVENIYKSVC